MLPLLLICQAWKGGWSGRWGRWGEQGGGRMSSAWVRRTPCGPAWLYRDLFSNRGLHYLCWLFFTPGGGWEGALFRRLFVRLINLSIINFFYYLPTCAAVRIHACFFSWVLSWLKELYNTGSCMMYAGFFFLRQREAGKGSFCSPCFVRFIHIFYYLRRVVRYAYAPFAYFSWVSPDLRSLYNAGVCIIYAVCFYTRGKRRGVLSFVLFFSAIN